MVEGHSPDRSERLLVLGAGPAQLGLLAAARRRGLYVIAVDRCFLSSAYAGLGELDKAREEFALAKTWHEAHSKHASAAETARFLDEARAAIEAGAKR